MANEKRLLFKFYSSYFEIAQELNDKDRLAFYDALMKKQFTGIENLHVGMQIQAEDENDQPIQLIIKEIKEDEIVVDFNHPLAGKDLEYKIKIDSLL